MLNRTHAANSRPFVFKDAVELLEGKPSSIVGAGDRIATASILTAGVVGVPGAFSLLGPKNAAVKLCDDLSARIPNNVQGSSGVDRRNLLVAAHSIIVITSFFDAASRIQERVPGAEVQLTGREELQMTRKEDDRTKEDNLIKLLLTAELPYPRPELTLSELQDNLGAYYQSLASSLIRFCTGLSFWDELDDRMRRDVEDYFQKDMPRLALGKYEDSLRKLAVEVREFELWLNQLTAHGLRSAFHEQGRTTSIHMDRLLAGQRQASQQLQTLQRYLQRLAADIQHSEERTTDVVANIHAATQLTFVPPDVARLKGESGVSIPALSDLYIEPPFKVATGRSQGNVSNEEWWANQKPRHDLDDFFGSYLTASPGAFTNPLLVLGHPGSGKSSLTRVLAARLPDTTYVPIRVELRRTTPSRAIEAQIEEGLSLLLGRKLTWSHFREATTLTPVIFLDGLDELIQASDEKQADYLERVQFFQQRELANGGVYVIVTSRTVVAHQARIPPSSVVLKIDDFKEPEIAAFVQVWNDLNDEHFREAGLSPLPKELPREVTQLAGQPLLLLLLALLDADSNALQRDAGARTRASTYRQLLTTFVGREVLKHQPQMDTSEADDAVQSELLRLSFVALGMFNRGVQMVGARHVADDLTALDTDTDTRHSSPLEAAQKLLGRFFFVHQAQTKSSDGSNSAYEFLHSTFGEFLVANLAYQVISETYDEAGRKSLARFGHTRNADDWASTLFTFQTLTQRTQILEFFAELAAERATPTHTDKSNFLVTMAIARLEAGGDDLHSQGTYRPLEVSPSRKLATYTCNLILLACCISEGENRSQGPLAYAPTTEGWDSLVHLWKSQLEQSAWEQLSQVLWARSSKALWTQPAGRHDVQIGLEFLTPATSSEYHLSPISNRKDVSSQSLQLVFDDVSIEERTRLLIDGSTAFGPKSLISATTRAYFLARQDIYVAFDANDLLGQIQNPRAKNVPTELVEPALRQLMEEPLCATWLAGHITVILSSSFIEVFEPSTVEQLVELVIANPPGDLNILLAVLEFIVDEKMDVNFHPLINRATSGQSSSQFFAANPGFTIRLAAALDRGGHKAAYSVLENWDKLVSQASLGSLFQEDVKAPLTAVSAARRHGLRDWATTRGIVEASGLPRRIFRRITIEDAAFLINCGARDRDHGLRNVRLFCDTWVEANKGPWHGRRLALAKGLRPFNEEASKVLQTAKTILSS